ncbi:MAG: SDR family NAD(P)-dependent oxidoreductase, partial [Candidatus Eremiobacteraeota bacterium]|nr:SDR family NAD(P)-dependent oxidoreductase [Candidatus Eremiobacteraeota bacterium]
MIGKIAVVTGASRGIGRAIAVDLARAGADVALLGRDEAALEATAELCRAAREGARSKTHVVDVTDEAALNAVVAEIIAGVGRIDIAVANAGQAKDGLILRFKAADLDRLIDVNL